MVSWRDFQNEISFIAERQLFFIGGAPRSGTTWLQHLLDAHPAISCSGEGLFLKELAVPLERLMAARRGALETKNTQVFKHSSGYSLPDNDDTEFLLGTAILLALRRQSRGKSCLAIGEKTPENVFFYPRLKDLFPTAKFIGILRDPRDILTSAWHFFHPAGQQINDASAKAAFIERALRPLDQGARAMVSLAARYPQDCALVTYETLSKEPEPALCRLFQLLGLPADSKVASICSAQTSFEAMVGGRLSSVDRSGSFFRKGVVGDWPSTLTPAMNARILRDLQWMYRQFGWEQ